MNRGKIALVLALVLTLCVVPALAEEDTPADGSAAPAAEGAPAGDSAGEEGAPAGEDTGEGEASPEERAEIDTAGDDEETGGEKSGGVWPEGYDGLTPWVTSVDDDLIFTGENDFRSLRFQDLRDRVLEGNLSALMLEESIASIDAIDFTRMHMDLASQLNSLEYAQAMYAQIPVANAFEGAMQGFVISNLQSSYSALSGTVTELATGRLQKDYAAAKRQLQNAREQMVIGAESLYITILELEQTKETLQRNLEAVDRSMEEMELRYQLGQISALTLEQVKSGRASLQSSLSTLDMNLKRCKLQMQAMIGAGLNGSLVLSPLPELDSAMIDCMDLNADLSEAKDKSYDLFAAKKKLDEASDDYDDTQASYARDTYNLRSARHTYEAAKYEYQVSVQNFEMGFRNAYDAVKDYRQILNAAQTTLAFQESTYASMELKYQQGTISHNALLTAADELAEAKDTVATAKRNLFTAYRTYYWAVNYGIMNSAGNAG